MSIFIMYVTFHVHLTTKIFNTELSIIEYPIFFLDMSIFNTATGFLNIVINTVPF